MTDERMCEEIKLKYKEIQKVTESKMKKIDN